MSESASTILDKVMQFNFQVEQATVGEQWLFKITSSMYE